MPGGAGVAHPNGHKLSAPIRCNNVRRVDENKSISYPQALLGLPVNEAIIVICLRIKQVSNVGWPQAKSDGAAVKKSGLARSNIAGRI